MPCIGPAQLKQPKVAIFPFYGVGQMEVMVTLSKRVLSDFSSLDLSFLVIKMGLIIPPTSQGRLNDRMRVKQLANYQVVLSCAPWYLHPPLSSTFPTRCCSGWSRGGSRLQSERLQA